MFASHVNINTRIRCRHVKRLQKNRKRKETQELFGVRLCIAYCTRYSRASIATTTRSIWLYSAREMMILFPLFYVYKRAHARSCMLVTREGVVRSGGRRRRRRRRRSGERRALMNEMCASGGKKNSNTTTC